MIAKTRFDSCQAWIQCQLLCSKCIVASNPKETFLVLLLIIIIMLFFDLVCR